ncbi:MAG: hypothetical protein JWP01_1732 [Myxococcales bacterium]|jgi:hypothetical protein|nr:hypothetical protein [Myxococcales bacterium]
MPAWSIFAILGAGAAFLASRGMFRRSTQSAAADAAGLSPAPDLTHLTPALQRTALWTLSDGGFERRVVHGVLSRNTHDIDVTAFDLETLRERRGEWAFLPLDRPFRIGGVVSVVACEVDRAFPHMLFKRAGGGDELEGDTAVDRASHIAKVARAGFGMAQSYPAELPSTLSPAALTPPLPEQWRAYGDPSVLTELLGSGFAATLAQAGRRDLVIELLDTLILIYPAARDVVGADSFADLTATALAVTDGVLAASRPISPRGVVTHAPA